MFKAISPLTSVVTCTDLSKTLTKQGFRNSVTVTTNMGDGKYEETSERHDYTAVPFPFPQFLSQGLTPY